MATSWQRRFTLWIDLINDVRAETVVEIGVWRGEFAAAILDGCPSIRRYYMIDPWRTLERWNKPYNVSAEEFDENYRASLDATAAHESRRTVLRGTTREVVDRIPDDSLDLVYVDGDHTLRGITLDLLLIWPKLRAGGLLGGDDFAPNPWYHPARFEPSLVFPFAVYFAEAMDAPMRALPYNQFLIEKRTPFSFTDSEGKYGALELGQTMAPREPTDT